MGGNNTYSVSVIIPVYNSEKWLRECIDSVLSQTIKPVEIIVVNDGSTDKSLELLKNNYDRLVKILNQENRGAAAARNFAAKVAKGEWLAFLDSDDTWDREKLERQLRVISQHPSVVSVYCNL